MLDNNDNKLYPLDVVSTYFHHEYLAFNDSCNHAFVMRLDRLLDRDLLKKALELVIDKQPVLHSRIIADRSQPRYWYYWQKRRALPPLPLVWKNMKCDKQNLEKMLRCAEHTSQNEPVLLETGYPFRLIVRQWRKTLTHVQLVISHVVADGRSLPLFFRDLWYYYQTLERGGHIRQPETLSCVPGDWENLFKCQTKYFEELIVQKPIQQDNRIRQFNNLARYDDERDWPTLLEAIQKRQQKNLRHNRLYTFPQIKADYKGIDGPGLIHINHHHIEGIKAQRLLALARKYGCSLVDFFNLAYILVQMELADIPNERDLNISVKIPTDMRSFTRNRSLLDTMGNLIINVPIQLPLKIENNNRLALVLIKISKQKLSTLRNWKKILEKRLLFSSMQEHVPEEYLSSFLKALETPNKSKTARPISMSHLGPLDYIFKGLEDIKISRIESIPITQTLSVQTLLYGNTISVAYSYSDRAVDKADASKFRKKLMYYLETFDTNFK